MILPFKINLIDFVIFLETKLSFLLGDSWLYKIPEHAKINEDESFNQEESDVCPFEFGDPSDEEETLVSSTKEEEVSLEQSNFKVNLDEI